MLFFSGNFETLFMLIIFTEQITCIFRQDRKKRKLHQRSLTHGLQSIETKTKHGTPGIVEEPKGIK